MGTIFVAYGGEDGREAVLSFAAERAAAAGDDLYVYHVQETAEEQAADVREEVAATLDRLAPEVAYEVAVETREAESDATNVSNQKRLVDAILEADREFVYVVMGEIEHGPIERIVLPSMTEAVLEAHEIPVVLVPA